MRNVAKVGKHENIEVVADLWDLQSRDENDPAEVAFIRRFIRKGNLRKARELLDTLPQTNASLVNLNGVVHELEGEQQLAFQFYGLALKLDPRLGAAEFNFNRLRNNKIDDRICL